MLCGSSVRPNSGETWVEGWTRLNRQFGPLKAGRIYSATGCPGPNDPRIAAVVASRAVPLISFKAWDASSQANYAGCVRTLDRATFTYHHEPEDDNSDHQEIGRVYTAMRTGLAAANKPGLELWHILMGWSADPRSGRRMATYLPESTVAAIDGIGWDVYAGPDTTDGPTRDPVVMFGRCAAESVARGKRWGVFETGALVVPATVDAVHAAWYQLAFDVARNPRKHGIDTDPAAYFTLWNSTTGGNDYRVDGLPLTVAAWRAACADETDGLTDPAAMLRQRIRALESQLATLSAETGTATAAKNVALAEVQRLEAILGSTRATMAQIAELSKAHGA